MIEQRVARFMGGKDSLEPGFARLGRDFARFPRTGNAPATEGEPGSFQCTSANANLFHVSRAAVTLRQDENRAKQNAREQGALALPAPMGTLRA